MLQFSCVNGQADVKVIFIMHPDCFLQLMQVVLAHTPLKI